jgi:hypothetical protein
MKRPNPSPSPDRVERPASLSGTARVATMDHGQRAPRSRQRALRVNAKGMTLR